MIFEKHREGKETKDCWKGVVCFSRIVKGSDDEKAGK